jgi:hypothetical protein
MVTRRRLQGDETHHAMYLLTIRHYDQKVEYRRRSLFGCVPSHVNGLGHILIKCLCCCLLLCRGCDICDFGTDFMY